VLFEMAAGFAEFVVVVARVDGAPVLPGEDDDEVDVVVAVAHGDPPATVRVVAGCEAGAVEHLAGCVVPLGVGEWAIFWGGAE
jgi:hypothetical protein